MALTDLLTESSNVSAIIELITLFFIVAGFFRWYDSRYQKFITNTKTDICKSVTDTKESLSDRLERIDQSLIRLEDRFHKHIEEEHFKG